MPEAAAPGTQRPAGAPLRIVLADGSAEVRALFRVAFARFGDFEVVAEASDAEGAARSVAEHHPDAIVLDLALPAMEDLGTIGEIARGSPATRIVVSSGFAPAARLAEALRLGAHAHIEKGEPLQQIAATLRAVCDRPALASRPLRPTPGADTMPQDVLSVLAHEISNPLAVIRGFAETLSSDGERFSAEERERFIAAILRGADQVQALVGAFADVRGVDTDAIVLAPQEIDLGSFVRQVAWDLRPQLGDHLVEIDAPDALIANVDVLRMRQVVVNLLSNAAKFSPPGTPIELRVARTGGELRVSVTDRGSGVPPQRLGDLFKKFVRLHAGNNVAGMGLGLYISRGIARAHGGDLVYERAPGGGSSFVVRLPG